GDHLNRVSVSASSRVLCTPVSSAAARMHRTRMCGRYRFTSAPQKRPEDLPANAFERIRLILLRRLAAAASDRDTERDEHAGANRQREVEPGVLAATGLAIRADDTFHHRKEASAPFALVRAR